MKNNTAQENPSAAAHPLALRVSSFLVRGMLWCSHAMGIAFLAGIGSSVCGVIAQGKSWGDPCYAITICCAWIVGGCFAGYALCACLRMVLVAIVFVRYSLAQLLSVVLLGGTFMTLIIKLPGDMKALPGIALAVLVFGVLFYTAGHDPEDNSDAAHIIRKLGPGNAQKNKETGP